MRDLMGELLQVRGGEDGGLKLEAGTKRRIWTTKNAKGAKKNPTALTRITRILTN
jgi:hypothetical protein